MPAVKRKLQRETVDGELHRRQFMPVPGGCGPFCGGVCVGAGCRGVEGVTTGGWEGAGPSCEGPGGTSVLLGGSAAPGAETVEA